MRPNKHISKHKYCFWTIPPNLDSLTLPNLENKSIVMFRKININLFSLYYPRSKTTASFLLF